MCTALAMYSASALTSFIESSPMSGSPRAAAMAAPEIYTASNPARSICIAVSALKAPGITTSRSAISSRRRRGCDGVSAMARDFHPRHHRPHIPELVQVPDHLDQSLGTGGRELTGNQASELRLDLAIRHRLFRMSKRVIHLLDVFFAGCCANGHSRRHGLRVGPMEVIAVRYAYPAHEIQQVRISQAPDVKGSHRHGPFL